MYIKYFSFLVLCLGFLTACTPLLTSYPEGVQNQLHAIKIDTIPDRIGQYLRIRLLKTLMSEETHVPTRYRLGIQLAKTEAIIGIGRDATTRRMRVTLTLSYTLQHLHTGETLKQGALKIYGSYNYVIEGFYANTVAAEAILPHMLDTLAYLLVLELADYFKSTPRECTPEKVKRPA